MKIAVDARELVARPTGVGRYLGELLNIWATDAEAGRHDWRLFAHAPVTVPLAFRGSLRLLAGSGGWQWEQRTLSRALRRERPDVLFAPGYSAPLTAPAPIALTIHDVSFAAHPEWFSFREGLRRRVLTRWSARRARVVLTDSHFSRDEIATHLGIPAARVRVIPLGLVRRARPQHETREPIVLYVGSIFRRRHVETLIDVFVRHVAARLPTSRLEVVGENRLYPADDPARVLRDVPPEIRNRVVLRSYVDEATLAELYGRASVFVFLSEYEGFGFTPLEALASGVPPIVLDTPVAREVYGAAAYYLPNIRSTAALGEMITSLLTSAGAREQVLLHAAEVLARYDWTRTARATLTAIEEAAGV